MQIVERSCRLLYLYTANMIESRHMIFLLTLVYKELLKMSLSLHFSTNNINILIYKEFMKCNCRILSEIYNKCKQWSKMHNIKFLMTKHELIHFTRTFKWFNMKVDVKLTRYQINLKSNIRVLKVQLNFKLKWVIHIYHVKAKLVIKQKIMQTIIESTWDLSMMMNKQIYFAMMRSLLSHKVIIWYTSQRVKDHWKNLNIKLKLVQERVLQQIINVYHATSTETLQMKTNMMLINIYLQKLIQRLIINMNSWKLSEVIETTARWICNDLILKRDWKSKLCKTSLQLKQKWMKETLE